MCVSAFVSSSDPLLLSSNPVMSTFLDFSRFIVGGSIVIIIISCTLVSGISPFGPVNTFLLSLSDATASLSTCSATSLGMDSFVHAYRFIFFQHMDLIKNA